VRKKQTQRKRKLNICRLIFEFVPGIGGSVFHTIELSKHINPYLNRQILIVPRAKIDSTALDKSFPFVVHRIRYCKFKLLHWIKTRLCKWLYLAPLVLLSYQLFALVEIFHINRKYGIDIIHAHGIGTGPIATIAGRLLRKQVVWMLDGTAESYSRLSGKYETAIIKLFKPDYCLVVDNGGPARNKFTKLFDKDKLRMVYINISPEKVHPISANTELVDRLQIKDNFIWMSIHNLEPVQGVKYAIRAFKEFLLLSGSANSTFLIIGDGSLRIQLEQLTLSLGLIERALFLGTIDNLQIPEYYALANIVLATSVQINMNTSTVEAMSCGKPVVAFNCGNTGDRLIQHMKTGLLAQNGNIHDLAEKMLLLYQNPGLRKKLGENARNFIVEHRSWEGRIKTELSIYEKLLQSRRS
jgi:glycosyltransferase involved in cell wall biosynthesis